MVEVSADAQAFRDLGRALAGADTAIRREFSKALRDVAAPYGRYVLLRGASELPKRGGLAYTVASGRVTVQATAMRAVISLRTKSGNKLGAVDQGTVRHPVFARQGQPRRWVDQRVEPGAFTRAFDEHADSIRPAMIQAGQRALQAIAEGKP